MDTYSLLEELLGSGTYGPTQYPSTEEDPIVQAYMARKKRWDDSVARNRADPRLQAARSKGTWGILSEPREMNPEIDLAPYLKRQQDYRDMINRQMQLAMLGAETRRYEADKAGEWKQGLLESKAAGQQGANQRAQMRSIVPLLGILMRGRGGGAGPRVPDMTASSMYSDLKKLYGQDVRGAMGEMRSFLGGGQQQAISPEELMGLIQALQGSFGQAWGGQ